MQPAARQLKQKDYNNGNRMFFMWSVARSYLEDNWGDPAYIRGFNLAAVKHTTVQVTRLPLLQELLMIGYELLY
jgi:hypothetical protein